MYNNRPAIAIDLDKCIEGPGNDLSQLVKWHPALRFILHPSAYVTHGIFPLKLVFGIWRAVEPIVCQSAIADPVCGQWLHQANAINADSLKSIQRNEMKSSFLNLAWHHSAAKGLSRLPAGHMLWQVSDDSQRCKRSWQWHLHVIKCTRCGRVGTGRRPILSALTNVDGFPKIWSMTRAKSGCAKTCIASQVCTSLWSV